MDELFKAALENIEKKLMNGGKLSSCTSEDLTVFLLLKINERLKSIDDTLCVIDGRLFELVEKA